MNDAERRYLKSTLEYRKGASSDKCTIAGQAAVFNSRSQNLGGYYEMLADGCFTPALEDPDLECYSLFNHEASRLLGVTTNGSVRVSQDKKALNQETDLDGSTEDARSMAAHVATGRITRMSFAMYVAPDGSEWSEDKNNDVIRTVTKVSRLADVSPVTYAAYDAANIGMRSMFGSETNAIISLFLRAEHNLKLGKTEFDTLRDWQKRIGDLLKIEKEDPETAPVSGVTLSELKGRFSFL
jgi:uncharacterized protein